MTDYVKQTWIDGSGGGTPTSAARLGVIEQGIFDAHYQPAVRVFHNAGQSINNSTDTVLAFNSERFDQSSNVADTMHDTVTNNSRLTCRYAGVYSISVNLEWAGNATGVRLVIIRYNATTSIAKQRATPGTAGVYEMSLETKYQLAVNDFVDVVVNQNSGGALSVDSSGNYTPEFSMVRVA